jgi:hypothetical protein
MKEDLVQLLMSFKLGIVFAPSVQDGQLFVLYVDVGSAITPRPDSDSNSNDGCTGLSVTNLYSQNSLLVGELSIFFPSLPSRQHPLPPLVLL